MLKSIFALLFLVPALTQAQSISFTFDDGLDPRVQSQAETWTSQMLSALAKANVKAMLFPAGKIVGSPEGMSLVKKWSDAGHNVGNHTYSHENLGSEQISLERFAADVLVADEMFKGLRGWMPRLRFPYLKEGESASKRDGMRQWMQAHEYLPAPVSIDASDWYYNDRYLEWRKSHLADDASPYKQAYLSHLWNRAKYYDGLAKNVIGRSPAHVIVLHTSAINAAFLPDVLAMFQSRGWKIISPAEAFRDAIYSEKPSTVPAGESIVWALAKQANLPGLRYPAEDDVYEKPILDALGL